jgi:hypothetical protein
MAALAAMAVKGGRIKKPRREAGASRESKSQGRRRLRL